MLKKIKQKYLIHKENKRLKEEQEFNRMIDELQELINKKRKEIEDDKPSKKKRKDIL